MNFPKEPVAAASLGQVYKATIRDAEGGTRDVAVKVQRPNIMNQVALDMHLIREVAPIIKRTFNLNTDFVGVVDTWGSGFIDELDYIEEALNAKSFTESISNFDRKLPFLHKHNIETLKKSSEIILSTFLCFYNS